MLSGKNVIASISAVENGQNRFLGQSNATGEFSIRITDATKELAFRVKGYPTTVIPISKNARVDTNARFRVDLPMIMADSQQVRQAYLPAVPTKHRSIYFQTQDARAFRRIPATVCFRYASSGRTQCVDISADATPTLALLNATEKITFEVRAKGYQPYSGTLTDGQTDEELYVIKLLMPNNVLVASYELPANQKLDHFEFRHVADKNYTVRGPVPPPTLGWNTFKPGNTYRFTATGQNGEVVADEQFRMEPGWTFVQFHAKPAAGARLMSIDLAKPTYFDSAVLYFNQSEYALGEVSKRKLDSISWRMIKLRPLMAQVTGHTDNVGPRSLNLTLSEYRTRVVSNYLHKKGVDPNQLVTCWQGPNAPVASNDTELNKAKNRRVVLRFFSK